MSKSATEEKNILEFAVELEGLMRDFPDQIDQKLVLQGQEILRLTAEEKTFSHYPNFHREVRDLCHSLIQDLSGGGHYLHRHSLGLVDQAGTLERVDVPYGQSFNQELLFRISLKKNASFANWDEQKDKPISLSFEDMNAAIYFLISYLAKL